MKWSRLCFLLCFGLSSASTAICQVDDLDPPYALSEDEPSKASIYGSFYLTMGSLTNISPGQFDEGEAEFLPGTSRFNIGLGSAIYNNRHHLQWELTFNHRRKEKGKFFRNLENYFVTLRYGYDLLKNTRHTLYPYTGVGYAGRFQGRNNYYSSYFGEFKDRILNYSMFYFDEGIGYTYAFEPEKANLFSTMGVMLGTMLSGNRVMSPELVKGEDIEPAFRFGLYARVTFSIAYSMVNRSHLPVH